MMHNAYRQLRTKYEMIAQSISEVRRFKRKYRFVDRSCLLTLNPTNVH